MRPIIALVLFAALAIAQPQASIPLKTLRDKIAGGWAGQMIGVSYGAPTEFRYNEKIIPVENLPKWTPDKVSNSINQDDLYVDMTFAQVLDDKGLKATTEDFGAMFRNAKYALWHANLASRRALKRGVPAALAGTPRYNAHANDIDFQIEADFVGLMAPGMLKPTVDIAMRAGRVMNYGDGIYGGVFVGCMYSAAFFEKDPRKLVEAGLSCIPAKSPYALLISDVLAWHKQYPNDWEANWREIEKKWNKREPCPAGAMRPFNIDAKINGAYIVLGLLYGGGDMEQTIVISTRGGQDSDCNPASAAGILGVALGYDAIPDKWKSGIPAIADKKFNYTEYTFKTIVDSSLQRSIKLAEANGGQLEGDTLTVVMAPPKAPKLELWDDYGSPVERIAISDARWTFTGDWKVQDRVKASDVKGASAEVSFEGTGFIVVGPYLADGGWAEVWIDGKKGSNVDVYPDEPRNKGDESVCHAFKLKSGMHTVKLVVTGVRHTESKGARIGVQDLVVFR